MTKLSRVWQRIMMILDIAKRCHMQRQDIPIYVPTCCKCGRDRLINGVNLPGSASIPARRKDVGDCWPSFQLYNTHLSDVPNLAQVWLWNLISLACNVKSMSSNARFLITVCLPLSLALSHASSQEYVPLGSHLGAHTRVMWTICVDELISCFHQAA